MALTLVGMENAPAETGVNQIVAEPEFVDVYSTLGVLLKKQVSAADALSGLPMGIYIVNGKKAIKTSYDR